VSESDIRAIRVDELERGEFPRVELGFRVHIAEQAFDRAIEHAERHPDREVGGVLVGRVLADDQGPFVLAEDTIEALHADEKDTELTFTHATWDHIHGEMDRAHAGQRVVGWYHTHPGFGIFLSDRDRFIQSSFFDLPYQIALVYDPRSREHGIFTWQRGAPRRCRHYWVGTREHRWEPPPREREVKPASQPATEETTVGSSEDHMSAHADGDFTMALARAAVLLLLGALVGWWLGGRTGADERARLQQALASQQAAGAAGLAESLNRDLVDVLRDALGASETASDFDAQIARLDAALGRVSPDGEQDAAAVGEIRAARDALVTERNRRRLAFEVLRSLEQAGRAGSPDPRQVQQILADHSAALGQLCVEFAERARAEGDERSAERFFELAVRIDPAKRSLYESKRDGQRNGEEKR